jgi:hypothetical protein
VLGNPLTPVIGGIILCLWYSLNDSDILHGIIYEHLHKYIEIQLRNICLFLITAQGAFAGSSFPHTVDRCYQDSKRLENLELNNWSTKTMIGYSSGSMVSGYAGKSCLICNTTLIVGVHNLWTATYCGCKLFHGTRLMRILTESVIAEGSACCPRCSNSISSIERSQLLDPINTEPEAEESGPTTDADEGGGSSYLEEPSTPEGEESEPTTDADDGGRSSYPEPPSTPEIRACVPDRWSIPEEERKFLEDAERRGLRLLFRLPQ